MDRQEPIAQTMKISEVRARLSSLVNEVYRKEKRVLVEKSGIPVAAVDSVEDLERLRLLDRQTEERLAAIEQMREASEDIPPEQIERDVVAIIRDLRAEEDGAI